MASKRFMFFVVLLTILATGKLVGQVCSPRIYVQLENQKPCESCLVQVIKMDSISLLGYNYTDSLGQVQISNSIPEKDFLIHVSNFGYKDSMMVVSCEDNNYPLLKFSLRPLSINLDEITVVDKIALLKKSGDTTIFNLKALEKGNELSTYDIINRFPGIDMTGKGFTYHGKKIDEIFLDDIDISDSDQKQFTKNIRYDLIEQIQILENQNTQKALEVDSSKLGLVMRIKLNESARDKYLLGLEGGSGYPNVYLAKASVLNVSNKNGLRLEATLNNSYKDNVTEGKEFIIDKLISEELFNNRYKSVFETPYFDKRPPNSMSQRCEKQGKVIYSKNIGEGSFKTINSINTFDGRNMRFQNEEFILNGLSFETQQDGLLRSMNLNSLSKYSCFLSKRTSLNIRVPVYLEHNNDNNSVITSNERTFLSSVEDGAVKNIVIAPGYRIEHSIKKTLFRLIGNLNFKYTDSEFNYFSTDSLFSRLIVDENIKSFGQSEFDRFFKTESQLRIKRDFNNFKLVLNSIFIMQKEKLEAIAQNLNGSNFTGTTNFDRFSSDNSLFLEYEKKKIKLQSGIKYFGFNQQLSILSSKDFGIRPYLFALYEISRKWNVSASFNIKNSLPNIYQLTQLKIFRGIQIVESGTLPLIARENRKNISLSLFKDYETGENSTQFNAYIGYVLPYNVFVQEPIINLINVESIWQLGEVENEVQFNLYYARYLRKWNFSVRFNSIRQSVLLEERQYNQLVNSLSTSAKYKGYRITWHALLNVNNTMTFQTIDRNNSFIDFSNKISHERKNFSQSVTCTFTGTAANDNIIIRPILSTALTRVFPEKNIEVSIIGSNITNLNENIITRYSSSLQSLLFTKNVLQRGNIMLTLRKLI